MQWIRSRRTTTTLPFLRIFISIGKTELLPRTRTSTAPSSRSSSPTQETPARSTCSTSPASPNVRRNKGSSQAYEIVGQIVRLFSCANWRPEGPIAASAACREGGAMRRPEGTRRERSGGGMPRRGSCEAAGVIMSFAQRSLIAAP